MATDCSGRRDVALPDAGALDDPLVRGVQRPGEIGVGEDAGRHRHADARHLGKGALHHVRAAASRWANSAPMCLLKSASTDCTATRMAFLMALAGEAPWQMMDTPFTPEQRRAAVLGVVENAEQLLHLGPGQHLGQLLLDQPDEQAAHRFIELEHHVAHEPVAHHHVHHAELVVPGDDVAALDVADIVQPGLRLRRPWASRVMAFPFSSSSPTLSSPTVGLGRRSTSRM